MSEVLNVKKRTVTGSRNVRRLRQSGIIPANLYGHGQASESLQMSEDNLLNVVKHGARVVDLAGDVQDKAFIRELQWDVYGVFILHVDMARVSADEKVELRVAVELRGTAIGQSEGGVVEHILHEVEIECPAISIPEKVILKINDLKLNGNLTAAQIELPPGAKLLVDPEVVVAHCAKPKEASTEAAAGGAEPELIRKPTKEDEAE